MIMSPTLGISQHLNCRPVETSLRSFVLAHLGRDIQFGIVEIPTDLQTEFPEIYAERGIL
jgi:phage terminase Nu1 subunit (DNA packaging protein)